MIVWFIIGITVLISYIGFQNRELSAKLQFNAAQIIHRKEYYRLISHAFIHANWSHLGVNMLVLYFFGFLANAPCYRLYGTIGTFFSCLVLLLVTSIFFIRFLKEWNRLWLANDYHNTNVVIDQEKGRYDYANGFSFDEKKGSHQKGTPTYMILIYLLAPVGVGIAQILSGTGATSLLFVFIWLGGSYTFVGFNKSLAYHYFTYRKLAYFEKQTGKKIINGLL